jgi:hypothetical protein
MVEPVIWTPQPADMLSDDGTRNFTTAAAGCRRY